MPGKRWFCLDGDKKYELTCDRELQKGDLVTSVDPTKSNEVPLQEVVHVQDTRDGRVHRLKPTRKSGPYAVIQMTTI